MLALVIIIPYLYLLIASIEDIQIRVLVYLISAYHSHILATNGIRNLAKEPASKACRDFYYNFSRKD